MRTGKRVSRPNRKTPFKPIQIYSNMSELAFMALVADGVYYKFRGDYAPELTIIELKVLLLCYNVMDAGVLDAAKLKIAASRLLPETKRGWLPPMLMYYCEVGYIDSPDGVRHIITAKLILLAKAFELCCEQYFDLNGKYEAYRPWRYIKLDK